VLLSSGRLIASRRATLFVCVCVHDSVMFGCSFACNGVKGCGDVGFIWSVELMESATHCNAL